MDLHRRLSFVMRIQSLALLSSLVGVIAVAACHDHPDVHFPMDPVPLHWVALQPDTFSRVSTIRWRLAFSAGPLGSGTLTGEAAAVPGQPPPIEAPPFYDLLDLDVSGLDTAGNVVAKGHVGGASLRDGSASSPAPIVFHLFDVFQSFSETVGLGFTGSLVYPRPDGSVVMIGGSEGGPLGAYGGTSRGDVEAFDFHDGSVRSIGSLVFARRTFGSTRLNDGRYLLAGGRGDAGAENTAEIWDPLTQQSTEFADQLYQVAGYRPNVVQLPDGRVWVIDGVMGGTGAFSGSILDLGAGITSPTVPLFDSRDDSTTALLMRYDLSSGLWEFTRWGVIRKSYREDLTNAVLSSDASPTFYRAHQLAFPTPILWEEEAQPSCTYFALVPSDGFSDGERIDLPAATLPGGRCDAGLALVGTNQLLVAGGASYLGPDGHGDVLVYDFASHSWSTPEEPGGGAQHLAHPRVGAQLVQATSGVIVVVGGNTNQGDPITSLPRFEVRWSKP